MWGRDSPSSLSPGVGFNGFAAAWVLSCLLSVLLAVSSPPIPGNQSESESESRGLGGRRKSVFGPWPAAKRRSWGRRSQDALISEGQTQALSLLRDPRTRPLQQLSHTRPDSPAMAPLPSCLCVSPQILLPMPLMDLPPPPPRASHPRACQEAPWSAPKPLCPNMQPPPRVPLLQTHAVVPPHTCPSCRSLMRTHSTDTQRCSSAPPPPPKRASAPILPWAPRSLRIPSRTCPGPHLPHGPLLCPSPPPQGMPWPP